MRSTKISGRKDTGKTSRSAEDEGWALPFGENDGYTWAIEMARR